MAHWLTIFASSCCKATVVLPESGEAYCAACLCRQPEHDDDRIKRARERRNRKAAR